MRTKPHFKNRKSKRPRRHLIDFLESRLMLNAGGGYTGSGIPGNYYNNTTFSGSPSFLRVDDRIDFNFGSTETPGGSNSPGFNALGITNWSAQWAGQVIPKYSETYTFTVTSEGEARFYIVPYNQSFGSPQINDFTEHTTQATDTYSMALTAGQNYNIELQYATTASPSEIKLHWSSPSTPDEVIEAATPIGVNGGTAVDWDPSVIFADAIKESRMDSATLPNSNTLATLDSNGWPTTDIELTVFAGLNVDTSGEYTLNFTGSASVNISLDPITVLSNTYSSATNTTTVVYKDAGVYPSGATQRLTLTNTKRTPTSATGSGVTNISIMRPESAGSWTSYPAGTLYTNQYESLINKFTAVRFMDYLGTNSGASPDVGGNATVNWTDRLIPADSSQQGLANPNDVGYQGQGGTIEYAVELANETGKDMWINIPSQANDTYVTDLANGLLYGFNATGGVYTQPTLSPAYPPLNSNLKVYVEYSNEVWNGGFQQNSIVQNTAVADVNANNATGQILNFDGIGAGQVTELGQRYWALRTVQISNDFRAVWGNAAMITTVRPVFEFQYNDINNTAGDALGFISDYFDNADGIAHVATPQPVNYYLYGAGGGWYNSVNNDTSLNDLAIPNNSFQTPSLATATSQANPTGGSWAFNGAAGVVSNNNSYANASTSTNVSGATILTPTSNGDAAVGAGYKFTVGSSDLYINQLGRWIISGNKEEHTLFLTNTSGGVLAQGDLTTVGQTAGQYAYVSVGTVHLLANQTYYVFSTEPSYDWQGFDSYYSGACTETTFSGITINNALSVTMPQGEWYTNLWTFTVGTAGDVGGPVDFRYLTTAGTGPVTYAPSTANGSQGAYIQGSTGTISQTLTFPTGVADVNFYAAQGAVSGKESFSVYINGALLATETPSTTYYSFYRTNAGANLSGGTYTLSFVGSGTGTAFIDLVQVETSAYIVGTGDQNIASQTLNEVDWATAYGLKTVGYEGGFEVGGDLSGNIIAAQAANLDPSVVQSTISTVDEYLSAGGNLPMVFTAVGEWWSLAMTAPFGSPNIYSQNTPKLQGYASLMSALPVPDSNATVVPGVLTPSNVTLKYSNISGVAYEDNAGNINKSTGWISWNTMMPSSGSYLLTLTTTGTGSANLIVDGTNTNASDSNGSYTASVNLSAGPHTIVVESTSSAAVTVNQILVTEVGARAAPVITSSSFSGTTATLSWQSVTNASGYVIGYGSISGQYTNFVNVGNVTTGQVTGLSASGVSYMVVYAYNSAAARSLPSGQVRVAPRSTNTTVYITFNDQTTTNNNKSAGVTYVSEPLVDNGLSFISYGNSGGQALQLQDGTKYSNSPGNWPFETLEAASWGTDIIFTGSSGQAFDLYSLDVGQGSGSQSAVLTETDTSGGTQIAYVNFPGGTTAPLIQTEHAVVDWIDIVKVEVTWWTGLNGGGTQHSGSISNLLIDDAPPTVATAATAGQSTVTGASTSLSVLGADHFGAGTLTYTWAATTVPNGVAAPTYSVNATNAAQNTTAYFAGAGSYVFTVTISDSYGATVTATVPVTVVQTLTGLTISPATTTVADGATQSLTAAVTDQFGVTMGTQPGTISWSISNASTGSVNSSGLYIAPGSGTGWATITATGGGYTASAQLYFTPAASMVPNFYAGFPNSNGLNLEGYSGSSSSGAANVSGGVLQLTDTTAANEIHSAFYSNKLSDTNFVTDFGFQDPNPFEDGFTFIIQNQSATDVSNGGGGQIGYQNIGSSVGVRFDLDNTNNGNTISIATGGSTIVASYPLATTGLNLMSGDVFHAHVAYNGSNLAITLTDTTRPNQPSVTEIYAINIQTTVGSNTAWFGFGATSGGITGGVAEAQNILWWTYGQPIISVIPVTPTLQSSPVQSITVSSTRPISLGVNGLSLVDNGQTISLGSTPAIGTVDGGLAYTIGNLASPTGNLGQDTFAVTITGNTDIGGNSPAATASTSWTSNTLTAAAGASINIAGEAGSIDTVTVNGGTPYNVSMAGLSPIYVNGTAGNVTLTLDYTNASPVPAGGITFTGATGDVLNVTGTSGNDTASMGGSALTFDSSTINLPGVPTLTLNTVAGNDILTQTTQPTAPTVTFNGGTGTDQLNISGGTYTFNADPQPLTTNLTVEASGAGTQLLFNPVPTNLIHLTGLILTGGATATVASLGNLRSATNHRALIIGNAGQTSAPTFSIAASSSLDLKDNDLIIHGGNLATINPLLTSGYNTSAGGYWNGTGIISSTAAAGSLTTLGAIQPIGTTTFDGESVGTSDVIVKFTYYGDSNLDGKVDGSDYSLVDNGYLHQLTGWYNGDFNNDGVVNGSDYTLIDNAFEMQASPLVEIATPTVAIGTSASVTARNSYAPPVVADGDDSLNGLRHKRNLFSHHPLELPAMN